MKMRLSLLGLVLGCCAWAQKPYEVRISKEVAPPGGVAQVKLTLTDPEPIITGSSRFDFDSSVVDFVLGISVYSPAGDAIGTATYQNGRLAFQLNSPLGSMGTTLEYPFLTVAVAIRKDAKIGAVSRLALDLGNSRFINQFGQVNQLGYKEGSITVGGTMSIDNILPGGGWVAPGQTVSIVGRGFTQDAKVRLEGQDVGFRYVSSNQLDLTATTGFLLDGHQIRVRTGKDTQLYYSYLRPQVAPTQTVFSGVVPLFSWHAPRAGLLWFSPAASARAVALQNPQGVPVEVTIAAPLSFSSAPYKVTVPVGSRVTLDLSAMFPGATAGQLSMVRVSSAEGLPMMGLEMGAG
ncbi:MAG: IPT/TIG domain-containing protein, partial [Acidobacteria bacterium]|nr:IPT/TIG domain-containing protein [Acidobacteriota bacterium]